MVFLTGPRQVGKTFLARAIGRTVEKSAYLNYDNFEHRAIIEKAAWLPETRLLILDELHKMKGWKNFLKGVYDTRPEDQQILITGSARLETFRGSGDSLAGRFFRHRLMPLSLSEIPDADEKTLTRLLERGGFPEPFLCPKPEDARRWRRLYLDGLLREDLLSFEKINDFKAMNLTVELLRRRVGSPLSWTNLAADVGCAPNTVKRYVAILEALFIVFRVSPWHRNIARSLHKEAKFYFYDHGLVIGDHGVRLENLVAVSLLKYTQAREDEHGADCALMTMRTKEKQEVDFVIVEDDQPRLLLEVKTGAAEAAPGICYFYRKYGIRAIQLVQNQAAERLDKGVEIRRMTDYLTNLRT